MGKHLRISQKKKTKKSGSFSLLWCAMCGWCFRLSFSFLPHFVIDKDEWWVFDTLFVSIQTKTQMLQSCQSFFSWSICVILRFFSTSSSQREVEKGPWCVKKRTMLYVIVYWTLSTWTNFNYRFEKFGKLIRTQVELYLFEFWLACYLIRKISRYSYE